MLMESLPAGVRFFGALHNDSTLSLPDRHLGLIQAMEIDKKVAGGKIKFVMSEGIGKTRFCWLAPDEILRGLGA